MSAYMLQWDCRPRLSESTLPEQEQAETHPSANMFSLGMGAGQVSPVLSMSKEVLVKQE